MNSKNQEDLKKELENVDWEAVFAPGTPEEEARWEAELIAQENADFANRIKQHHLTVKNPADYKKCPRCSGQKIFQQYIRVNGGICFKCNGAGIVLK